MEEEEEEDTLWCYGCTFEYPKVKRKINLHCGEEVCHSFCLFPIPCVCVSCEDLHSSFHCLNEAHCLRSDKRDEE